MRPPKLHVTLLSAILLLRADARLLGARIALEVVAASFFTLARSVAHGWIERLPLAASSWTGALLVLLVGAAVYWATRVIARVGAIAVIFADARRRPSRGLVLEGCDGFALGATGTLGLLLLDLLAGGCLLLSFDLSTVIAARHGTIGAAVGAVTTAIFALGWLVAATYGSVAFVLGVLDGDGLSAAWPRALRLIGSQDPDTRGRFSSLLAVLGALSLLIGVVDFVSSSVSTFGGAAASEGTTLLVVVPILTLVYSMVVDVAALVFLSAVTDRLPLGFATPIVLTPPREQDL